MKSLILFLLTSATMAFADETKTNEVKKAEAAPMLISVSAAKVTGPFVMTNGTISQMLQRDINESGKAVFSFSVTNAGDYLVKAQVKAPEEDANSFFLNIDAQPEDPTMIWDVEVTTGWETRTVNWRGNGAAESDEFIPKVFHLAAGEHKLIVIAREPGAELKSVSIVPKTP
jgi:hypothetical protein